MAELEAVEILNLIDDPEVTFFQLRLIREARVKHLIQALHSSSTSRQRETLCYVLGKRCAKSALRLLIECLNDSSNHVRSEAAQALGRIGLPIAGPALYERYLIEEKPGTKSNLAAALGEVKYQPAIPALIKALKDPDRRVWNSAAESIPYIPTQETINELERALEKETDETIKKLLRKLIGDIANQND